MPLVSLLWAVDTHSGASCGTLLQHTDCNTLQHNATHHYWRCYGQLAHMLELLAAPCCWPSATSAVSHQEYDGALQVCCSVLQCAAACCSVLPCVAVCCSVLQCVAVCCRCLTQPHHLIKCIISPMSFKRGLSCTLAKEPYKSTKEPYKSPKEPYKSTKEASRAQKRALHASNVSFVESAYKRDLPNKPTNETYKSEHQKRPVHKFRETEKRDLKVKETWK